MSIDLKLHRLLLCKSLAALDCELFEVPAKQMSCFTGEEFYFDGVNHITQIYINTPFVVLEGYALVAPFTVPDTGLGFVGSNHMDGESDWPRVIWVSNSPAFKPVLPLQTGTRPSINIKGLIPGKRYWLCGYTPLRSAAAVYWGKKA